MQKVRRHTYSRAALRDISRSRLEVSEVVGVDQELEDLHGRSGSAEWEAFNRPADLGGLPLSQLPQEARVVSFAQLAMSLAEDPRGYALLTGVERGAAGLESFRLMDWSDYPGGKRAGAAFSFCVNDRTYTAFESPGDGYRSSMAFLIEREGNWCESEFEPCALHPQLEISRNYDDEARRLSISDPKGGMADILALIVPGTQRAALSVGTSRADDWYPSFVGYHDPEALGMAREMGVALAYELDAELPAPAPTPTKRPRKGL